MKDYIQFKMPGIPLLSLYQKDHQESPSASIAEINAVLAKCSAQETKIITETVKSLKLSMDKYL